MGCAGLSVFAPLATSLNTSCLFPGGRPWPERPFLSRPKRSKRLIQGRLRHLHPRRRLPKAKASQERSIGNSLEPALRALFRAAEYRSDVAGLVSPALMYMDSITLESGLSTARRAGCLRHSPGFSQPCGRIKLPLHFGFVAAIYSSVSIHDTARERLHSCYRNDAS